MFNDTLHDIHLFENGMQIISGNDLEKWRAETLFTKEPETIAWLNSFSEKSTHFFDVGANIGIYSLYAAYINKKLNVYSFEPVLNNFNTLYKNKLLNKLNNLTPFHLALSSTSKLETIYISDTRVGNSGAQISAPINELGESFTSLAHEIVLSLNIDKMIAEYGFPVPDFVKIDVDGHEIDILEGAKTTLANPLVKSILIEINGQDNLVNIDMILTKSGFTPDDRFNFLENHSSKRRREKKGNVAKNVVYTKL